MALSIILALCAIAFVIWDIRRKRWRRPEMNDGSDEIDEIDEMIRWEALKIELGYINKEWGNGSSSLSPAWLMMLMEIAEEAEEKNWDAERIYKEMEYGR